jgi:phospholipid N-methyltransferase
MIPKRYRAKNGRMKWSYIWTQDGTIRPQVIKAGFHPDIEHPHDIVRLLDHLFPNQIIPGFTMDVFNDKTASSALDDWFLEYIKGSWQLWMIDFSMKVPMYYFENVSDALLFKMRWS